MFRIGHATGRDFQLCRERRGLAVAGARGEVDREVVCW